MNSNNENSYLWIYLIILISRLSIEHNFVQALYTDGINIMV